MKIIGFDYYYYQDDESKPFKGNSIKELIVKLKENNISFDLKDIDVCSVLYNQPKEHKLKLRLNSFLHDDDSCYIDQSDIPEQIKDQFDARLNMLCHYIRFNVSIDPSTKPAPGSNLRYCFVGDHEFLAKTLNEIYDECLSSEM